MKVQQQLTPLAAAIAIVATTATRTLAFAPSRDSTRTCWSSSHLLHAATPPSPKTTLNPITSPQPDLTFTPPDPLNDFQITDPLCAQAASKMKRVMVPVSPSVSSTGYVGISYIHFAADENAKKQAQSDGDATLPLLLVHGFDSSALEFRRLGPQLSSLGIDVYCVDLLGWGYTQLDDVASFSAQAKIEALEGFWKTMGGYGEVVVGGASLGGAAVIEFAAKNLCRFSKEVGEKNEGDEIKAREGCVRGTVLLDAQGFVDGIGPMSFLPSPLARLGIQVLKSEPLRESANQMSYFDKEQFATEDALKVGRMHCLRDGWEEGMLSFMQSGGFRPKEKVGLVDVPSLVIWGRDDGILEKEFAQKFVDTMPDAKLQWIERCGHVPHLEQPELTAKYIAEFMRSDRLRPLETTSNSNVKNILNNVMNGPWGAIGLGGVAVAAATGAAAAGTLMGGGM